MTEEKPPPGTRAAGRKLWESVLADFELDRHELVLLVEAVRAVDELDQLHAVVQAEGTMVSTPAGPKVHPALIEARQLRLVLARILAALRLPGGDVGDHQAGARPQRRVGVRKPYGIRGTVA